MKPLDLTRFDLNLWLYLRHFGPKGTSAAPPDDCICPSPPPVTPYRGCVLPLLIQGEIPWSTRKSRDFLIRETLHKAYVNRIRSIEKTDYTALLKKIDVPTLILTPEEDKLIGKETAGVLLNGIKGSQEVVMPRTGHMFRFSHPGAYSLEIRKFLERASL
ncbi:pimeloyl-ACP methyl ester carboxylesterase [Paraburkholderia sp. 40]